MINPHPKYNSAMPKNTCNNLDESQGKYAEQ